MRLSHQWKDDTHTSPPTARVVHGVSIEKSEIQKCNLFQYNSGTSSLGNLCENCSVTAVHYSIKVA